MMEITKGQALGLFEARGVVVKEKKLASNFVDKERVNRDYMELLGLPKGFKGRHIGKEDSYLLGLIIKNRSIPAIYGS